MRHEIGNVTTEHGIERIIRKHFKKLQAHKFHSLDEVGQFFEKHKLANTPNMRWIT